MKISKDSLKSQIDIMSDEQLENLNEYIHYHFSMRNVDPDIAKAKNKIYMFYKEHIAPLMNKIEIYEHRFPMDAYAGIETIFRYMSSIEKEDKETALKLYDDLLSYSKFFCSQLSVQLTRVYIDVIKGYLKKLTKFNYTGVYPDFKKETLLELKEIKKRLKIGLMIYDIKYDSKSSIFNFSYKMDKDVLDEQQALQDAWEKAECLITKCQNLQPEIIASGYSNIILDKILPWLSILLSIAFSVIGVIGVINLFS